MAKRSLPKPLAGVKILVTAGPTRERWDAVRFLSNYSSGRMGYALAEEARRLGGDVTLISGPVRLAEPAGIKTIQVEDARQMAREVKRVWSRVDVLLMTAAVADFRPLRAATTKQKKKDLRCLELVRNPDILLACGKRKGGRYLLGFAAESNAMIAEARRKLKEKNLDCIVANRVGGGTSAMGGEFTAPVLVFADGRALKLGKMSKAKAAKRILEAIVREIKIMVKRQKEKG